MCLLYRCDLDVLPSFLLRSILTIDTESSLDDLPTKYRLSLSVMDSIQEHRREGGSEEDGETHSCENCSAGDTDSVSDSGIHEEVDHDEEAEATQQIPRDCDGMKVTTRHWGRGGRSTMGWPSTPGSDDTTKKPIGKRQKEKGARGRSPPHTARDRRVPQNKKSSLDESTARGRNDSAESDGQSASSPCTPSRTPPSSASNSPSPSPPQTPVALTAEDIERKKRSLTRILQALSTRFESVGYCQGLDRIVVHCMRACRCAVSARSFPSADIDQRDEIDEGRERECFSFLQELFEELGLCGE